MKARYLTVIILLLLGMNFIGAPSSSASGADYTSWLDNRMDAAAHVPITDHSTLKLAALHPRKSSKPQRKKVVVTKRVVHKKANSNLRKLRLIHAMIVFIWVALGSFVVIYGLVKLFRRHDRDKHFGARP